MKYIFLDVDGVLNSQEFLLSEDGRRCHTLDETRIKLLGKLCYEEGAVVVLSSSWRIGWMHFTPGGRDSYTATLSHLFHRHGIRVVGCTQINGNLTRKQEILAYVGNYLQRYDAWVAIDDEDLGLDKQRFVKTDFYKGKGLEEFHIPLIKEALNLTQEEEWGF